MEEKPERDDSWSERLREFGEQFAARHDGLDREYVWYRLGCQMLETTPMSRETFRKKYALLKLESPDIVRALRLTPAEMEADRNQAEWDVVLQGLSNLGVAYESLSELVEAIQMGKRTDFEEGAGGAGARVPRLPRTPVLVGSGAKCLPYFDVEPGFRDS